MSEQLVPQIRVAGFDGEWVDLPFNQMAHRRSSIVPAKGLPQLEYEDIESGFGRLNKDLRDKTSQKNGIRFERGDVLFGKLRPYLKNWFLPDFEGLAVGDFWVLAPDTCTGSYLYGLIQAPRFTVASSISSGSKMPRSDWPFVSQTSFASPVSREEQDSVGSTFLRLERLVNEHRQKHRRLQQAKASLMQRMFPAPGETEPEIRLGGFSGGWRTLGLGEFSIKTGPFGSSLHAEDYVERGTPIVTTEHFKSGRLPRDGAGVPQVSDSDASRLSTYKLEVGDIVFSRVGSVDLNAVTTRKQAGWLFSGRVLRVRPTPGYEPQFLHAVLETDHVRQSIVSRAVGQTMPSLNTQILGATEIVVPPTVAEQQAIGAFFAKLDDLIEAEVQYVSKLQQVKSALLQKMFV